LPLVAVVGQPNVGKSTLFNRLIGQRRSIVGDEPGITRDRIYGEVEWAGQRFSIVDTGGIVPDDDAVIPANIFKQAGFAIDDAQILVWVVDARQGLTPLDEELAKLLRATGKRVLVAANKSEAARVEAEASEFYRFGFEEVFPVSAEQGIGLGELLDAVVADLKQIPIRDLTDAAQASTRELRLAIIGRPNVGKSSLLNRLIGEERVIVSPVAGTTRDVIDTVLETPEQTFRLIDTAGIRRKGKTGEMAEKLSVVMARKNIEDADIALFLVDATEGVSGLDASIAGYADESGRSVIIVVNKWDLVTSGEKRAVSQSKAARIQEARRPQDRKLYEERLRYGLKFLSYAPVLFISAENGKGTERILPLIEEVAKERRKRVSTGEMNRFLKTVDFDRASVPGSKRVRIYYMTQAAVAPPTFILFTDRPVKLHFSYQRFLENQIRAAFGFMGTPIWIKNRSR